MIYVLQTPSEAGNIDYTNDLILYLITLIMAWLYSLLNRM